MTKTFSFCALACAATLAPVLAFSQGAAKPSADSKPSAKPSASAKSRAAAGTDAKTAAPAPLADGPARPLNAAELEIAKLVYTGRIPCELGAFVTITPEADAPGYFIVDVAKMRYRMAPVESRTGAVRLEDQKNGAVMIQLGNKSMLMNQKAGQRLADECMSPQQAEMAAALKKNPMPSLLDPLPATPAGGATVAIPVTVPQTGASTTVVITSPAGATVTATGTSVTGAAVAVPSGTAVAAPTDAAPPAPGASAPR